MPVSDIDRGWNALRTRLEGLAAPGGAFVTVGVQGDEGGAQHAGSDLSVAELAAVHEYGTSTIPERSFLRAGLLEGEARLRRVEVALGRAVVLGLMPEQRALALLGEEAVGLIKSRISDGIPPPNAPATIARKGSSTPLIDTGQLLGAITYAVEGGS